MPPHSNLTARGCREIERWSDLYPVLYRGSPLGRQIIENYEFCWPNCPAPTVQPGGSSNSAPGKQQKPRKARSSAQPTSSSNSEPVLQQSQPMNLSSSLDSGRAD